MKFVTALNSSSPISFPAITNDVRGQRGVSLRVCKLSVFIFALLCVFTAGAQAHHASDSYLSLKVDGRSVTGQWDVALLDLERVIGLDADGDGNITRSEVDAKRAEIERYGLSRLRMEVDGTEYPLKITGLLVDTFSDGDYNVLHFDVECSATPKTLKIDYRAFFDIDAQHRGLLRLECGGRVQTAVFSPEKPEQLFELSVLSPGFGRDRFARGNMDGGASHGNQGIAFLKKLLADHETADSLESRLQPVQAVRAA